MRNLLILGAVAGVAAIVWWRYGMETEITEPLNLTSSDPYWDNLKAEAENTVFVEGL